jgi:hypothetical protein
VALVLHFDPAYLPIHDHLLTLLICASLTASIGLFTVGLYSNSGEAVLTSFLVEEEVAGKEGPDVFGRFMNRVAEEEAAGDCSCD